MDRISQSAVREITRRLQEIVRSDWNYPDPAVHAFVSSSATDPTTFRERYHGTSDDSCEEQEHGDILQAHEQSEDEPIDAYRFDSPDAVASVVERKLQARKHKKRKLLEEELLENEGLRFFLARRNAWTAARPRSQVERKHGLSDLQALPAARTNSASSDSDSSTGTTEQTTAHSSPRASGSPTSTGAHMPEPSVGAASRTSSTSQHSRENLIDVLLPVSRPLIAQSNSVRASMTSRSLSELYEKVVRDNRSPAIPINLAHMTRVIVQGWKDDGTWPPQSSGFGSSVAAVKPSSPGFDGTGKSLKGESARNGSPGGNAGEDETRGILANHRHLRNGIDGVKRVLRLSGSHSGSARPKSTEFRSPEPRSPRSPLSPKIKTKQQQQGD